MIPIVCFIGHHNSGKTTLIRNVAKEFRSRGRRVAVIKSTKHHVKIQDAPGTDTYLYSHDGLESVALATPENLYLFQQNTHEPLRQLAERLFPGAELIIAEGFKETPDVPKIEVTRSGVTEGPLRDRIKGVVAVVSDSPVPGQKNFEFTHVNEIVAFIEKLLSLRPATK